MITYKRLLLNNIVYYDSVELDLDYCGTTVIMGLNLNSDLSERRNGAGKSLLVAPIAHLKFGDPSGLPKSLVKHSLLDQAKSAITWDFTRSVNGTIENYVVSKFRKGKAIDWSIHKDNEDQEPRTPTIAQAIIEKLIPYNEEEFYTTQYLDSRRPSVLVTGSPAHRSNYFMDLFRLHDFDTVKKYFSDEISELSSRRAKLDAYLELITPVSFVKRLDRKELVADVKAHKAAIAKLRKSISRLEAQIECVMVYTKHHADLELSKKFDPTALDEATQSLEQWAMFRANERNRERYKRQLSRLKRDLKSAMSLVGGTSVKLTRVRLEKRIDKLQDEVRAYDRAIDKYETNLERVAVLKDRRRKYLKEKRALVEYNGPSSSKLEANLDLLMERYEHLQSHKTSVCEYCGSKIDLDATKREIESIQKKTKALIAKMDTAIKHEDAHNRMDKLWNNELADELKAINLVKPTKPDTKLLQRLEALDLSEPEPIDDIKQPKVAEERLKKIVKRQQEYRQCAKLVKGIEDSIVRGQKVGISIDALKRKLRSQRIAYEDAIVRNVESTNKLDRYDQAKEVYDDLDEKIRRTRRKLKDLPILETLLDAYGPKGLRVMVMKAISSKIVENLNKYSDLLFPEPFKFDIAVEVNQFDIVATRKDGKMSDIRHMSGAESRAFALLWMISVLPLIPEANRSNLVILDEFEAGVDAVTRDLMINSFLPVLNTVVPHIIFLTPNRIKPNEQRRVFVAVKDGSKSELKTYEEAEG